MSATTLFIIVAAVFAVLAVAQERSLAAFAVLFLSIALLIPRVT